MSTMKARLLGDGSGPRLGMPAYEYPGGGLWRELAALPFGSLVVVDPADGPGNAVDPTYVAAISTVRGQGVGILGYVTTDYGNRSADEMIREVASYERWYQPTGIFLDQTPRASISRKAIVTTCEYVRSRHMSIAINPGQPDIDPDDTSMCDYVVNFEGPLDDYRRAQFPSWTTQVGPEKFWHLVYDVPDRSSLRTVLASAGNRAGVVLVTDASMPNPWGRLPAYWKDELRLLSRSRQRGNRRLDSGRWGGEC